ncbi:MAG: P1 family peptidase, partial [Vicinamibacterales bacterium]
PITRDHVLKAIDSATGGPVEEGAVGAGAGPIAFGWKGGIGTSSRVVREGTDTWTIGVLVQTNYGGRLVIDGAPIWKELTPDTPRRSRDLSRRSADVSRRRGEAAKAEGATADGSCMIVVATDAPVDARELQRLAARAVFALARTGSTYSNGSGDFAIAFSTHASQRVTAATTPQPRLVLPSDSLSPLFDAVLDATEEAVDNSLLKATDVTSNGRTVRAVPIDALTAILKKYGR